MRTIKTLGKSFLIATAVLLASCNKDDNNATVVPTPPASNSSVITGKVDGADFSTLIFGTSTATCSRTSTGTESFITILGADLAANSITIFLSSMTTPGTYPVNATTDSFLNYSTGSGDNAYSTADCDAASGTITITASDATHIAGTFSFVGRDTDNCGASKTITEGSFTGVYSN